MKTFATILFALALSVSASAQSALDRVYSKYKGQSGITSIELGNELLKLAAALDPDDAELGEISRQFEGIRMLVAESGGRELLDESAAALQADGCASLMEVEEEGAVVRFFARGADGAFTDFSMLVFDRSDDSEAVVLTIKGRFSAEDLARLGEMDDDGYMSPLRKLGKTE